MRGPHDALLTSVDVATLWPAVEAAIDQIDIGIFVVRIDASPPSFVYVSERAARLVGRTPAELVGSPAWTIYGEAEGTRIRAILANRDPIQPLHLDLPLAHADGTSVPAALGAVRIQTPLGILSFGYVRDLTAEHAALEALRRSEARFRYLIEAAPDGVVILVGGRIVFINPRASHLLGAEHAPLGRMLGDFLPPADTALAAERIATMFRTGTEMTPNEYGVLADPARVVEIKSIRCEWEGKTAVLAFARDVTARKALAQKLVEADRLTALGTLAAGVAHEINNPLTYAQLSLQRVERTLAVAGLDPELQRTIQDQLASAQHGITRVATITSSLRTFARADEAPPGPTDVIAVVERALGMVANDLRHRAQLVRQVEAVPTVIANASRLEQVIVNLILNALQALGPDQAAAQITISIALAGDLVSIRVTDNGCGIPSSLHARVFDPFFTTKPIGEGMGLGLAVCKSIVDGFGGALELASTEGVGTSVTVKLRVHRASSPSATPRAPARTTARRRVLVVDDDALVRTVIGTSLEAHHEVTLAEDGATALAFLETTTFDAILCDMMMPGIDGREVHRRVAASHPGLERRIIFITGGTLRSELDQFLATAGNRCLMKPFTLEAVLAAVAESTR
jgi:PAS domain S-box-containing protein